MSTTHKTAVLFAAACMVFGSALAQTPPVKPTQTAPSSAPAKKAAPRSSAAASKTPAAAPLTTQMQKFSYALGMNLGTSMHKQSIALDPNAFMQGLRATLAGGKTALTEEQARAALIDMQNELRNKQQEKMKVEAEANKKQGDAFLAANKSKEGVVTLPSGLQYKILQAGSGPKPTLTDMVVCNYRGTLINGTEFDSSYKRGQPATFPVNGVIKGWTEALQLMPVGSKWQLFIPSALAYGDRGAGGEIGPGATLIFEVELISIQEKPKPEAKPEEKKPADQKPEEQKPQEQKPPDQKPPDQKPQ